MNNADISKKPKRHLRWMLVGLAALVVIFGIGAALPTLKSKTPLQLSPRQICQAYRQNLTVSIKESGDIRALHTTDYKSEVDGLSFIVRIVPEGTVITQADVDRGRILVELDSSKLKEDLDKRKIKVSQAEANLIEAREGFDMVSKQNESDISAGELEVKFALMELKKYLGDKIAAKIIRQSDNSDDLQQAIHTLVQNPDDKDLGGAALQAKINLINNIDLANEQLARSIDQYEGTKKLHARNYVSRTELEADRLSKKQNEYKLEQARTALDLFGKYDFPKQVEQFCSDYLEARRQLERIQAKARAKTAQAQAKLKNARAILELQKSRLKKIQTQLDACIIRATTPGIVIYGSSSSYHKKRDDPIEVGDGVNKGQLIITIPNSRQMCVEIKIHEYWVDKIAPGLPVKVSIDAYPDIVFSGKVLKIAPLPDRNFWTANSGYKVYNTTVSIDNPNAILRPGMTAKVEIIISKLQDALCVPIKAIANIAGAKYCYIVQNGKMKARKVETGGFNNQYIEIASGLKEGETISLAPPPVTLQEPTEQKQE